jgi:hypothetical protein
MEYAGCGSSWATMARPIAMMVATMPSMRSVLLSCGRLLLRRRYRAAAGGGDHRDPARASVEEYKEVGAAEGIVGRNTISAQIIVCQRSRSMTNSSPPLGSGNEEIAGLLLR